MSSRKNRPGRIFSTFLCCVLGVPTLCKIVPGMISAETVQDSLCVGVLMGIAYLIVRPIVRLISLPLGCLTMGLFNLAIDVGLLYFCGYLVPGFSVSSLTVAAIAALFINTIIMAVGGFR